MQAARTGFKPPPACWPNSVLILLLALVPLTDSFASQPRLGHTSEPLAQTGELAPNVTLLDVVKPQRRPQAAHWEDAVENSAQIGELAPNITLHNVVKPQRRPQAAHWEGDADLQHAKAVVASSPVASNLASKLLATSLSVLTHKGGDTSGVKTWDSLNHFWHEDVFTAPAEAAKHLLHGMFEHETDWLILGITVLVLAFLDSIVLRPLAGYFSRRAIRSEEETLKKAFDKCERAGHATKQDLIPLCEDDTMKERLQRINVHVNEPISWEDLCRETEMSNETVGMGSVQGNVAALCFWVAMAAIYNGIVWVRRGEEQAVLWCTGYLLEWLLSLDNLFVFHLIFRTYRTPRALMHKALFLGILGAVVFRMCFFLALSSLLHVVEWVRFVFGLLLIYSGIQAARGDDDDVDVADTLVVRGLKGCLGSRLLESYDTKGQGLFAYSEDGRWRVTLLVLVIFCLEMTDIFFAIDSVSAKVAQIPNYYIAYSSSVLALFGLRAMFFLVQDMVDAFDLLKYGLCFILVFIGIELMLADWVQLPAQVVCVVIVSVFTVGIGGSLAKHYIDSREGSQDGDQTAQASVA